MHVSWRNIAAAAGAVVLIGAAATAVGQPQSAGCCVPPPPPPPPPPPTACCNAPRNLVVGVPGVTVSTPSIHVGAASTTVAGAAVSTTLSSGIVVNGSASSSAYGSGSASGSAYVVSRSGGYAYGNAQGVVTSQINGLTVQTYTPAPRLSEAAEVCVEEETAAVALLPVQAICIDDRNTPHPASRVDDGERVGAGFEGELYRCMAGTHMQVTTGRMVDGKAEFATGETISCAKGEALWHGAGGKLSCRPQKPERNCNERSLLRKFGPGLKLVEAKSVKKVCKPAPAPRAVAASAEIPPGDLMLDGGVGQSVW